MRGLFQKLPPFSPDTSGVGTVLFGLQCVVVYHDALGCASNFLSLEETRTWDQVNLVSSQVKELDVILGSNQKIYEKMENLCRELQPRYAFLAGSPIAMAIGTDLNAVAKDLEQKLGIPVGVIDVTGHKYYDSGVKAALKGLAGVFLNDQVPVKEESTINILGMTNLDVNEEMGESLVRFLEENQIKVISQWGMGDDFENMCLAGKAALNLVAGHAALPLARQMRDLYGIPYLQGLPLGRNAGKKLVDSIKKLSRSKVSAPSPDQAVSKVVRGERKERVLIIGEQVLGNSLRDMLQEDFAIRHVAVGSFFQMEKELMAEGDMKFPDETALEEYLQNHTLDYVIADPFFRRFLTETDGVVFCPLPHRAVSGKLYADRFPALISEKGNEWFSGFLDQG